MTASTQLKSPLRAILEFLELDADDKALLNANQDAYRITFEHHFVIELVELPDQACRVSARICLMGKSLSAQENQLLKAMQLYCEVQTEAPEGSSLSVSDHDGCLRHVIEIDPSETAERCTGQFQNFLNFSFVFKKTFLEKS
ncbi:MAG TPA: hypothetical protein VFX23_12065 [Limnobacter sp.]|uniref:hypothetical protein n=1 Tax=Limnobacter sp. TaxID=2003368 RepID=UPI002E373238|nr:hypothetical protein [Limnobacter sp.]HEX5486718.1 hypothetical protein [Limnobacter sp.]